jgi:hypothetical protein
MIEPFTPLKLWRLFVAGFALSLLAGCLHRNRSSDEQELHCSPMHNPPVQRLPPLEPLVWHRGARVTDSDVARLVVLMSSTSNGTPIGTTRVSLTRLLPTSSPPDGGTTGHAPQKAIWLAPDSAESATALVPPGRYAVRSIGIGYVERRDTVDVRGGFADTLQLDMRRSLICLY